VVPLLLSLRYRRQHLSVRWRKKSSELGHCQLHKGISSQLDADPLDGDDAARV
jgi:hypothetical protein